MRDLYLRTVQWALTGSLYDEFGHCRAQAATATEPASACAPQHWGPYNHTIREQGNDWPAVAHTMLGHVRLVNIRQVLERVLADHVTHVTLLERDLLPDGAASRPGVPQDRHVHVLLARGGRTWRRL